MLFLYYMGSCISSNNCPVSSQQSYMTNTKFHKTNVHAQSKKQTKSNTQPPKPLIVNKIETRNNTSLDKNSAPDSELAHLPYTDWTLA